jgi:hypothetical protein
VAKLKVFSVTSGFSSILLAASTAGISGRYDLRPEMSYQNLSFHEKEVYRVFFVIYTKLVVSFYLSFEPDDEAK